MDSSEAIIGKYEALLTGTDEIADEDVPRFEKEVVSGVIEAATEVLKEQAMLLRIAAPAIIVGDIHGNVVDLIRILRMFPEWRDGYRIVFLGDYVDRGAHSIPVITLLFAMLSKFPQNVFLIRGNHEFAKVSKQYGFRDEVKTVYGDDQLWHDFQTAFSWLPLAAVINNRILCVHGGLSPLLHDLGEIESLPRPMPSYDPHPLARDLVWSDPHDTVPLFAENQRGTGVFFGPAAVSDFLTHAGLKLLVRSHQVVADGYALFAQNAGLTVFSSSEYCRLIHNKSGVLHVRGARRIDIHNLSGLKVEMTLWQRLGVKRVFGNPASVKAKPKL